MQSLGYWFIYNSHVKSVIYISSYSCIVIFFLFFLLYKSSCKEKASIKFFVFGILSFSRVFFRNNFFSSKVITAMLSCYRLQQFVILHPFISEACYKKALQLSPLKFELCNGRKKNDHLLAGKAGKSHSSNWLVHMVFTHPIQQKKKKIPWSLDRKFFHRQHIHQTLCHCIIIGFNHSNNSLSGWKF